MSRAWPFSWIVSAVLHALPLLGLAALPTLRGELPIPVTIRSTPRLPAPPPRRAVPPAAPSTRSRSRGPRKGTGDEKAPAEPPAPPAPPPETADLRPFAPGDAHVVLLLRTDRLRASPHREVVSALLELLPDYRTMLGGSGRKPLDEFAALLIATPNPFDATQSFIAARHRDDPALRALIAERKLPEWDPRLLRFLAPTLTVLTRPEGAALLDRAAADGSDAGVDPRHWLADLERFDQAAERAGGPTLLLTVTTLGALARLEAGLPTPLSGALAMTADRAPRVRLQLVFASPDEAEKLVAEWPLVVTRYRTLVGWLGLGGLLDDLAPKREDAVVDISGKIAEADVRRALALLQGLIPRPPAPVTEAASATAGKPADGGFPASAKPDPPARARDR